jgi:NCAIR mutase (PurE)-related protein
VTAFGPEVLLDATRVQRIGLPEAIYCAGKSAVQIAGILDSAVARGAALLLTRLDEAKLEGLPTLLRAALDFDAVSRTAVLGQLAPLAGPPRVAIVTAGTSDVPVAQESARTLRFHGADSLRIADVGVAGLWRLLARVEELRALPVVIVAAGMDAALPSVIAGLVPGAVIAVPTSVGYGVAAGGQAALHALLASCAPGMTVVNIDNGYGAACAALRILRAASHI